VEFDCIVEEYLLSLSQVRPYSFTYAECGSGGSLNESDMGWVVVDQLRMTPRHKPKAAAAAARQPPVVDAG